VFLLGQNKRAGILFLPFLNLKLLIPLFSITNQVEEQLKDVDEVQVET
jgi:hypothetical protein